MARLYIPEPKIDLYKDGFDKHDKLDREATGKKLSDLVERIDDPLVIALDGAWGSGKSVFLKCWVGEHFNRKGNTTQTVYFDAFQHDYMDDPLIALTSAISERIERDPESKSAKAWRIAKNAAPFLGKAALRLSTAALIGKAISLTGEEDGELNDIGDKLAEEGGEIAKSLSDFWKKEDGKRAAMEAFRGALVQLTAPDKQGVPSQKLVIVIDELDRCRPDYALSVLEIIKHFFNERGVHFVLGVNLKELQNSVRARYGSGVNAAKYLQKFVSIEMPLKNGTGIHTGPSDYISHFGDVAKRTGAQNSFVFKHVFDHLSMANHHFTITLRDVEKIAVLIALIPNQEPQMTCERILLAGCIVLKIIAPQLLEKARRGELEFADLDNPFLLSERQPSDNSSYNIKIAWMSATKRDTNKYLTDQERIKSEELFQNLNPQEALRLVIANWLDGFEINSL